VRSEATTVEEYLAELPAERRAAVEAVRDVILANLPDGYVESMNWGMISYEVPLAMCPDTYNGEPLSYAGLASQKRHMALYLSNVYRSPELRARLEAGFAEAGLRLDMGASCVRFTRLDKLPLDVVGEIIAATPVDEFIGLAQR
jgi:hypothetical protein